MPKTILIVAAHTDDEAIGCGGTIARHVAEGDIVHALFLADGVSSRLGAGGDALRERTNSAERARQVMGVTSYAYLSLPDNRLDTVALIDVVKNLENVIDKVRPEIIYTHHHGDLNIDHRIAHQAVMTACRPIPGCSVRKIHAFEVMSSTEWSNGCDRPFIPNYFVDISDYIDIKMSALEAYQLEIRAAPHSRSREHILHLAHHRGNSVGMAVAEAFMTVRELW